MVVVVAVYPLKYIKVMRNYLHPVRMIMRYEADELQSKQSIRNQRLEKSRVKNSKGSGIGKKMVQVKGKVCVGERHLKNCVKLLQFEIFLTRI